MKRIRKYKKGITGRCCNYNYKPCYAENDIFRCSVGMFRLQRNEGVKTVRKYPKGKYCPYNEFSKFRVEDWKEV